MSSKKVAPYRLIVVNHGGIPYFCRALLSKVTEPANTRGGGMLTGVTGAGGNESTRME